MVAAGKVVELSVVEDRLGSSFRRKMIKRILLHYISFAPSSSAMLWTDLVGLGKFQWCVIILCCSCRRGRSGLQEPLQAACGSFEPQGP